MHASQGSEYDWTLLQTCISLLHHIGDFRMKLTEIEQRIIQAAQEKKKLVDDKDKSISYIFSNYKVTGKRELNEFKKLLQNTLVVSSFDKKGGIFSGICDTMKPICEYIHDTLLASIFTPIENQLKIVQFDKDSNSDLNDGSDLPDYSFAPQEFITMIGQVKIELFSCD